MKKHQKPFLRLSLLANSFCLEKEKNQDRKKKTYGSRNFLVIGYSLLTFILDKETLLFIIKKFLRTINANSKILVTTIRHKFSDGGDVFKGFLFKHSSFKGILTNFKILKSKLQKDLTFFNGVITESFDSFAESTLFNIPTLYLSQDLLREKVWVNSALPKLTTGGLMLLINICHAKIQQNNMVTLSTTKITRGTLKKSFYKAIYRKEIFNLKKIL